MNLQQLMAADAPAQESCTVVKLTTSYWSDARGVYQKRALTYLRRKTVGYNLLVEEVGCIGAEGAVMLFVNLNECADGVYYVTTCNVTHDYESGYVAGYDFELVPYVEGL